MVSTGELNPIFLSAELARLKQEQRELDFTIIELEKAITNNHIEILRLKKRKISLKDQISFLTNRSTPDIIA